MVFHYMEERVTRSFLQQLPEHVCAAVEGIMETRESEYVKLQMDLQRLSLAPATSLSKATEVRRATARCCAISAPEGLQVLSSRDDDWG